MSFANTTSSRATPFPSIKAGTVSNETPNIKAPTVQPEQSSPTMGNKLVATATAAQTSAQLTLLPGSEPNTIERTRPAGAEVAQTAAAEKNAAPIDITLDAAHCASQGQLGKLLDAVPDMRFLDLRGSELQHWDFKALGSFLGRPECKLEVLHIEGGMYDEQTANAFGQELANNSSLTSFAIQSACMDQPAWHHLLAGLATCKKLEKLVLHPKNWVRPATPGPLPILRLDSVINGNPALRELSFPCVMGYGMTDKFFKAIGNHQNLVLLDLTGSQLISRQFEALAVALEQNASITDLRLGDQVPDKEQADRINASLARNRAAAGVQSVVVATTASMATTVGASSASSGN
jgi:hypothetical protein